MARHGRHPQQVSGRNEHPPDLLLLADGRVLLTYGRRLSPCGVRGMVSHDQGRSWRTDEKLVLVTDSVTRDCGYPSSVQLGRRQHPDGLLRGGEPGASGPAAMAGITVKVHWGRTVRW